MFENIPVNLFNDDDMLVFSEFYKRTSLWVVYTTYYITRRLEGRGLSIKIYSCTILRVK